MWPPPNIQSLPSKEEIQHAKEEISTIELEIIETELRLDTLRKSLSERKAWIAPIRTIPPEILSLIFTETSRTNWKAPLALQRVSRQWRDVVVDSPEAWSFIPLSKYSSGRQTALISLFLERSRNKPLHICVEDESLLGYMEILAGRIECIYLEISGVLLNRYVQRGHTFQRLERLQIHEGWGVALPKDDPVAWDMLLFPNLQVLDINSHSFSLLRAISAAPEFPAIRHLTVCCLNHCIPLDILIKCATSLESVNLSYNNLPSGGLDTEHEVNFPRLRYMRLVDISHGLRPHFHLNAATPNLQAYLDDGGISLNTVKVDTDSVILLHTLRTPDLSRYPRLVTLSFRAHANDEEVIKAIEYLRANPDLCPDIALIDCLGEMTQEQLVKAEDALLARGRVTGQMIQLLKRTVKERAQMFKILKPCGDHMPCKFRISRGF